MPRTLILLVAALAGSCATAAQHDPLPQPVLHDRSPTADLAEDPATEAGSPAARLALLARGAEALTEDQPEHAAELLERFLVLEPGSAMAHFLLGVAHLDLGDHEAAQASLVQATTLDPTDAGGLAVLARVEYELGLYDEAVAALERALELEPEACQHYTSLGLIHYENGQWEQSYEAFLTAVELDPSDLSAQRGLARLYLAAGEAELAERAYRTAIGLSPNDPGLRVALSHVLRDLGRAEEALDGYNVAQGLDPDNPWISANMGSTLMELGRFADARPHFERALPLLGGQQGPDAALIHLNYGMLLESLGDLDGASESMEVALEVDPGLGPAHESLGLLLLDRGETAGARQHLDQAFRLGALQPSALVELVMLHEQKGDWEAALRCARSVLETADHDDRAIDSALDFRRAQLRMRSRHPDVHDLAAAEALLRPLVAGAFSHDTGSWLLLADVLVERGSLEEALGALDTVLADTSPEDPVFADVSARRESVASQLEER